VAAGTASNRSETQIATPSNDAGFISPLHLKMKDKGPHNCIELVHLSTVNYFEIVNFFFKFGLKIITFLSMTISEISVLYHP